MDEWWSEIDDEVLRLLEANGPMSSADLAREMGLSEAAMTSCVAMLASAGRLRLGLVELARSVA